MKLECRDLKFRYPRAKKDVLESASFTLESGSYWGVVGPNGAGKSTLLKFVSGLLPLDAFSGEVLWNGRPLSEFGPEELAREVAFVPAGIRAQFPITVFEFILQGRYAYQSYWRNPAPEDHTNARLAIERTGIEYLAKVPVSEVSAGELQLTLIARAIAQAPQAYFFDEAMSHLDLGRQGQIFSVIDQLHRSGATVVLVSHDLNLAAEFCPNLLWLKDGRVVASGRTEEVLSADMLRKIYPMEAGAGRLEVGKNPFSGKPKVFLGANW